MAGNPVTKDADPHAYGAEYIFFCKKVKELTGINLHNYKSKQMHRRLVNYMNRRQIPDFFTFAKRLGKEPGALNNLVDYLTINVSEFFRNNEQWKVLNERVIPRLVKAPVPGKLHIWSAGSAAGQEAYSLAMTLAEIRVRNVSILGTDIDEPSLKKAREGKYSHDEIKNVPGEFLSKYFSKEGSLYLVKDKVKKMVRFENHNLLGSDYPGNMDLILCRNVLIYFTDKGKEHVVSRLASSLKPGGVLFMGATEAIFNHREYGLSQISPFFYERPDSI